MRRLVLDPRMEQIPCAGKRRAPEEYDRRLVQVGQRRPCHAREHGQARVARCQRRHSAHDREASQAVGHRHLHEGRAPGQVPPVRRGVQDEVRQHAKDEGGSRPTASERTDHRT